MTRVGGPHWKQWSLNPPKPTATPSDSWWARGQHWDDFTATATQQVPRIKNSAEAMRGGSKPHSAPIDGLP